MKTPNPDTVSFCIDLEKEKVGYYFNNSPDFIHERFMSKIFTVSLVSYDEKLYDDKTYCSGEIDADEFFDKLKNSKIKADTFFKLFLDHGQKFLPVFKKWEPINGKEYAKKII